MRVRRAWHISLPEQFPFNALIALFYIRAASFLNFFQREPKALKFLETVVQKRLRWESLRKDFGTLIQFNTHSIYLKSSALLLLINRKAMRFSLTMPLSLPPNSAEISNYALSKHSVLTQRELKKRHMKEKQFSKVMRDIRLVSKHNFQSKKVSTHIQGLCSEAIKLAEYLRDEEMNIEIQGVMRNL